MCLTIFDFTQVTEHVQEDVLKIDSKGNNGYITNCYLSNRYKMLMKLNESPNGHFISI